MGRTNNSDTRCLSDITLPKIRKTLHNVMLKYSEDPFYKKIDLIKKILRKLKVRPVANDNTKVRNMINQWIRTNRPLDEDNPDKKDVKTGIPKIGVLVIENNNKKKNLETSNEKETIEQSQNRQSNSIETTASKVTKISENESRSDSTNTNRLEMSLSKASNSVDATLINPNSSNTSEQKSISLQEALCKPRQVIPTVQSDSVNSVKPSEVPLEKASLLDGIDSTIVIEKRIPVIDLTFDVEVKKEPVNENNKNSNATLENKVQNDLMPEYYNYNYHYGYPYNYNHNYNYNYEQYYNWYYYNGYNYNNYYQYWNGAYNNYSPNNYTVNNN